MSSCTSNVSITGLSKCWKYKCSNSSKRQVSSSKSQRTNTRFNIQTQIWNRWIFRVSSLRTQAPTKTLIDVQFQGLGKAASSISRSPLALERNRDQFEIMQTIYTWRDDNSSSFSSRHLSLRMNATAIIHYDVRRWVPLLRIHPCTLCLQHVAPPATRPAKQAGMRNLRERDRWRSLHSMSGVHAVWRRDRTVWVFARVRRQNVDCFRVLMNNFSFLYSWYITV